jgi:uncharacterized lipoprotein YddW (UPF0748 family)
VMILELNPIWARYLYLRKKSHEWRKKKTLWFLHWLLAKVKELLKILVSEVVENYSE